MGSLILRHPWKTIFRGKLSHTAQLQGTKELEALQKPLLGIVVGCDIYLKQGHSGQFCANLGRSEGDFLHMESDNTIPKPKKLVRISSRLSICEAELPVSTSGFAATLTTTLLSALHCGR